jgi:hypothetical protein
MIFPVKLILTTEKTRTYRNHKEYIMATEIVKLLGQKTKQDFFGVDSSDSAIKEVQKLNSYLWLDITSA